MKTIIDIIQFLKRPDFEATQDKSWNKIKLFFVIFLWLLLIVYVANLLAAILESFIFNHPMIPNTALYQIYPDNGLYLFQMVLLGPIIEEFSYHYALGRFNLTKIKISLSLIISFYISYFLYVYKFRELCGSSYICHFLALYGTILSIATILFFTMSLLNKQLALFESKWDKYYTVIFYLSAILFAIYHFNMPTRFLFAFFAVALLFGYTRTRLGFGYVIALHMLWNTLTALGFLAYSTWGRG
ncbi:CPBP family glutamic-type intramembrane protease [uncultured Sanguibacteroides sp.]|uniref:CPBP family glutamic-type intramembrane protease n=1 Tax=uncultured Sanguibacteroides sp. TaxID=1635151 RepID=UPI0025E19696|nr:CPBP family glutamic-type intramembrane protease [uncultured Sanguibacteroides sp.]